MKFTENKNKISIYIETKLPLLVGSSGIPPAISGFLVSILFWKEKIWKVNLKSGLINEGKI